MKNRSSAFVPLSLILSSLLIGLVLVDAGAWILLKVGYHFAGDALAGTAISGQSKEQAGLRREMSEYKLDALFRAEISVMRPNVDELFTVRGRASKKIKYQVRYSTDEFGHRVSLKVPGEKKVNLVFLGCSFTFGEGVSNEESFPSQVAKRFPKANVFNYGVSGYSPSTVLRELERLGPLYLKGLPDLPTLFVFTYMDDHLNRMVGTVNWLLSNPFHRKGFPVYALKDDRLVFFRDFETYYDIFLDPLLFLGDTSLFKLYGMDFPVMGKNHFRLLGKVSAAIKDKLQHLKKDSSFAFSLFFPNYPKGRFRREIRQALENEKVKVFDFSKVDVREELGDEYSLTYDPLHPSAKAYQLYADKLMSSIAQYMKGY